MTTLPGELPTDLETCHQLIRELLETLAQQTHLNEKLQHQLEQLLRRVYGRRSEKLDPNQLLLFAREILAASATAPPSTTPQADATPGSTEPSQPKKNGHGRKPLPASLPRKPVLHDLAPEQLPCPECGTVRVRIGEETREQLEYVPASDNNAAERGMRPVALGRKNWLKLGSERGGRTAAVLMSIVQSCRSFGVEPFAYLRDVLDRVSTHPAGRIAELLPDAWKASRPSGAMAADMPESG